MKQVLLVANTSWYFYNFRLEFLNSLRERGFTVTLAAPEDAYSPKLRALGYSFHPLELDRKGMNPFAEILTVLRLYSLYAEKRPDLVHHHTVKCVLYGSFAARWAGVPAVLNSVTGLGHLFLSESRLVALIRHTLFFAYRALAARRPFFLFQNPDDLALFAKEGVVREGNHALVRGSGVDTKKFSRSVPRIRDVPVLLFASRLLREKGLYELMDALRALKKSGVVFEFRCAGAADAGNPSAVPADQLGAWSREGLVTLLGHVDGMEHEIAAADIIVLPSWREGLPKILVEGAAAGKALLASDVPGCREVVVHGKTGWLSEVKNSASIEAGLRALLSDPALRARLGAAARERAVTEFDSAVILEKTLKIYDRLLSQA